MVFGLNHFVHLGLIDKYHKCYLIFLRDFSDCLPFSYLMGNRFPWDKTVPVNTSNIKHKWLKKIFHFLFIKLVSQDRRKRYQILFQNLIRLI
jgi:hypothetical protein